MSADHYRTLAGPVEFRHKIERSEFLGIAFPVTTDDEFSRQLHAIEKRYFDATHHCWAYRLFASGETRERSSDAGEPSGTAGKPILLAIESAEIHDAAVVVVRWYGGVKLGTGGLARAYRDTAVETLRHARPFDRYVYARVSVTVPFASMNVAYRLIDPPHVLLAGEHFGETNTFDYDIRLSRLDDFRNTLVEKRLDFTLPRS
jgi:uncharacterized YigZ family protein